MTQRRSKPDHTPSLLYGKNPVRERLRSNPSSVRRVWVVDDCHDEELLNVISEAGVEMERASKKRLERLKRADRVQGVIAEVEPFVYTPFDDLITPDVAERPTLLMLDRVSDPHNLGSVLRSAACLGGFAVVIPRHESCGVTDAVLHVASGGENYVSVTRVTNLSTALRQAKQAGYWVAGSVVDGGEVLHEVELPFPLCMVMGSEGSGIRPGLEAHLDLRVRLTMPGAALTFNVAVASALVCYDIARRRPS